MIEAEPKTRKSENGQAGLTIHTDGLRKDYRIGPNVVHALRSASLDVYPGEMVAVTGPSGSGKSTFMNLIGCLDRPSAGTYLLDGISVADLDTDQLALVRNRKIGFIFQGFHLLPRLTALGNVMLPMAYAGVSNEIATQRAMAALELVGLANRADHHPMELSGGQQQRVAIARSLVNGPSIILADEPTGNLDSRTSVEVMAFLQRLNAQGITIVLVTHEPDIVSYCKRVVRFHDGRITQDQAVTPWRDAARAVAEMPAPEPEDEV